jgi:Cu+-exporting ATPase
LTQTSQEKSCCSGTSDVPNSGQHIDPVCGMTVDPENAQAKVTFEATIYYFCSQGCATKFSTNSSTYLTPQPESIAESIADRGDTYTCPMHPEVIRSGPGDCPSCGMPLEPVIPGSGDDGKAETQGISRRVVLSAALAAAVAFLSMADMSTHGGHTGISTGLPVLFSDWLQFMLSTPVVVWGAKPFFERGWSSVRNRSLNMFTLLSLGIGLPYVYSLALLIWLSSNNSVAHFEQPMYFESAVVIATLAWLGQLLEAKARVRSTSAVRELIELMPTDATVLLFDGTEKTVPIGDIALNAKVRVKPGERIPVDGVTIDGASSVNESMLTGESMPVLKEIGSHVSAGTINGNGSLVIEAKRLGSATTLSQIVDMVSHAQRSRVPVQQLADRVAAIFVPTVLIIAVITVAVWYATGGGLAQGLSAALAVLVVACPCALGLATPMSIIVASGRAARAGILFKEARSLQLLASVDTVVIDKTGTLTVGVPRLVQTHLRGGMGTEEVIAFAAALESRSEHPLASAVVAASKGLKVQPCQEFVSTPGGGVEATVSGHKVVIGTPIFLRQAGVECPDVASEDSSENVLTSVFVAIDGAFQAQLDFADELRAGAADSIRELSRNGLRVVMATGDSEEVAKKVASALGITEYHSRLLPADKADLVRKLQQGGARVAMAGDGINDAPSLVQADVGISLASGTDIAVHSSDMVLVNSDIQSIVRAQRISQAMLRNIKQNLVLAFAYNLLAIPVATGLLVPVIGFALDPMVAAGAMSVSSLAVIANALRLRNLKL